jgi:hypothetical protein
MCLSFLPDRKKGSHKLILGNGEKLVLQKSGNPSAIKSSGFIQLIDSSFHHLRIAFTPCSGGKQTVEIQVDGERILNYTGNLIDEFFEGKRTVRTGWGAATTSATGCQKIAFAKTDDCGCTSVLSSVVTDRSIPFTNENQY